MARPDLLLVGGSVGLLAAVTLLSRALVHPTDPAPLARWLAHGLPIAGVAIAAALMREHRIALAVVFGTSVALLSIVPGALAFSGSHGQVPRRWSGIWLFCPVVAALAFAAGFRGQLTWFEAGALMFQGLIVLSVAGGKSGDEVLSPAAHDPAPASGGWRMVEILALLALLGVGAWAAVRGAAAMAQRDYRISSAAVATGFLSAALALPVISSGTPLALCRRGWAAINCCVLIVLGNLCVLLPALVFIRLGQSLRREGEIRALDYPLANWRIDAMLLVVLSLVLVPVGLGRMRLDRWLATALVLIYCAYVLMAIRHSAAW